MDKSEFRPKRKVTLKDKRNFHSSPEFYILKIDVADEQVIRVYLTATANTQGIWWVDTPDNIVFL